MRAEHCRQAAVVAEARCARRDATHNDAFEHLVWLHSCSGSLGVMNARRLSHLKNAGASAALEIARQDVLADVQQHISLSTLDMARRVSDFSDVNNVDNDMKVCGSCGTRDPDDPYPREVTAAHMVNTMNFRVSVYELGSMNFRVLAHSPRPPPGEQLNVPQPGFCPLYYKKMCWPNLILLLNCFLGEVSFQLEYRADRNDLSYIHFPPRTTWILAPRLQLQEKYSLQPTI